MNEVTEDGSKYNFVVQVNKDIDLTEYSQFRHTNCKVTLKSRDPKNPRTIKAENSYDDTMIAVVLGADLTVEDIIIDGNHQKRLFYVTSEEPTASLTINDGVILKNGTTTGDKANRHGGAIYCQENGAVTINGGIIENNEAQSHGGAIYSNLHSYMPEYDDGSTGPLVQPPPAKDYYYNINTDATTVFKNNKAFQTFTPPSTKDEFVKLLYQSKSHPGTKYDHPLNNDDVNLIVFNNVIFHKNYDTDKPIHDAFLVLGKSKLGKDFPVAPKREGYTFKGWNT